MTEIDNKLRDQKQRLEAYTSHIHSLSITCLSCVYVKLMNYCELYGILSLQVLFNSIVHMINLSALKFTCQYLNEKLVYIFISVTFIFNIAIFSLFT